MSIKIKIKVTRETIDKSEQKNARSCTIANTLRDIFPDPSVTLLSIYPFGSADWDATIPVSLEMREFITQFDRATDKKQVKPCEFELEIPDNVIESLPGVKEVYCILENHPVLSIVNNEKEEKNYQRLHAICQNEG